MEMVLDVYKRPFDPLHPVICMDESPKQMIAETRIPIPASPGQTAKYDYEYRRCGLCNIFLACEPLAGTRTVKVTERKTKLDWAYFVEEIADQNECAEKITVLRCFKWLTSRYHEMRSEQGSRNQRAGRLNTQSGWNDWHPGGFMLPVIPTLNSEEPNRLVVAAGRLSARPASGPFYREEIKPARQYGVHSQHG